MGLSYSEVLGYAVSFDPILTYPTVWRYSEVLISVTCTGYTGVILVHGVAVMFSSISTVHGGRYKGCQTCSTGQVQHFSHGVRSRTGAYLHSFNFVDVPHVSCERYVHLGS